MLPTKFHAFAKQPQHFCEETPNAAVNLISIQHSQSHLLEPLNPSKAPGLVAAFSFVPSESVIMVRFNMKFLQLRRRERNVEDALMASPTSWSLAKESIEERADPESECSWPERSASAPVSILTRQSW